MPKMDFKCFLDNVTKLLTSSALRGKAPITRHKPNFYVLSS